MLKATKCKHFNGIGHDCCRAGVNYRALAGTPDFGMALRLPCTEGAWNDNPKFDPAAVVPCEKREILTADEIAAEQAAMRDRMQRQAALDSDGNEHHIWQCDLCPGAPWPHFDSAGAFADHLADVHQIERPVKSRREMAAHLDATAWHQTNYAHYVPDSDTLMGYESHRQPRRKR